MGNCIAFQRVVSWVDDGEWDFLQPESPRHCTQLPPKFQEEEGHALKSEKNTESEEFLRPNCAESSSTMVIRSAKPTHEVRIKITKKQLAEMLRQAENKGIPTQDLLASLIETAKPHRVRHRIGQCWRPGLQSIPEIVE